MSYQILTTDRFDKKFKKLDHQIQRIISSWIKKHLIDCEDPKIYGKALIADRSDQWRYRIGNYRLLAKIEESNLTLILIDVGHRKDIYSK